MKRFVLGFLCGALIAVPASVFASDQINAVLFPSKVTLHSNGLATDFTSADSPFINYNNHVYVPLRAFSEAMGTYVDFKSASAENGNINKIDIYDLDSIPSTVQDEDGYVSLYVTDTDELTEGNKKLSGLIKINKDFTGKKVNLGTTAAVIDNEWTHPLQVGQIRHFSTVMSTDNWYGYPAIEENWRTPYPFVKGQTSGPTADLGLRFEGSSAPMSDKPESVSIGSGYFSNWVSVMNASDQTIRLNTLKLTCSIYKITNGKDSLICSYEIPGFEGGALEMPASTRSDCEIPSWDFRDQNGEIVSPGKYAIQLTIPENFEYSAVSGSGNEIKILPVKPNMWNERWEFNLIK
jgi:hypothetical protein